LREALDNGARSLSARLTERFARRPAAGLLAGAAERDDRPEPDTAGVEQDRP
jgi:hypothetical protein